jgi:hypothetical protein
MAAKLRAMSLPISRRASADDHLDKDELGFPPFSDHRRQFILEQPLAGTSTSADGSRALHLTTEPDEMQSNTPGLTDEAPNLAKVTLVRSQSGTAANEPVSTVNGDPSTVPASPRRLRSRAANMELSLSIPPAAMLAGSNDPTQRPGVWRHEAQAPPTPDGWDVPSHGGADGLRSARRQRPQPPPTEWDVPFELESDAGLDGDHVTNESGVTAVDRVDRQQKRGRRKNAKEAWRSGKKLARHIALSDPKLPLFFRLVELVAGTVILGECSPNPPQSHVADDSLTSLSQRRH